MEERRIQVPMHYRPYPYEQAAWMRRKSGAFNYYFKLWARQLGKDADDMQHAMHEAWEHPGRQTAYIGLDNKWISDNIFKKYIDGRAFWDDYPSQYIDVKDTAKEVYFTNNPEDTAPSRIKFIGFLNDQAIIGSSYDSFYISEASLYPRNAFQFVEPIWDRKLKMAGRLSVNFNGTPRGQKNVLYDLLRTYTGVDDPDDFPGAHGSCYVDKVTIEDAMVPDLENGGFKKLYTPDEIELLRARYIRAYGNDALFRQEHYCDFTVVNAGLVYRTVEQLVNEGRYCPYNLDPRYPAYVAFDIASKGKETDATACIAYQSYNGRMFVFDIYEARSVSLVQALSALSQRDWWQHVRMGFLPWDSERSASSKTPLEEAQEQFGSVNWHALDKERVDRGIQLVREQLPNMVINSDRCDWLMECFNNYEYKRLSKNEDWSPKPAHTKHSHMMDALRYAVMGLSEMAYLNLNPDGTDKADWNATYTGSFDEVEPEWDKPYPEHWVKRPKKSEGGLLYYG